MNSNKQLELELKTFHFEKGSQFAEECSKWIAFLEKYHPEAKEAIATARDAQLKAFDVCFDIADEASCLIDDEDLNRSE